MNTFSVNECISFGWRTFKARPWFFVLVSIVVLVIVFISSTIQGFVTAALGKSLGGIISFVISLIVNSFVGVGFVSVYLKAHDAVMSPTVKDLWRPTPFVRYLLTYVLLMVILLIGYVLLIVPGIILSVMFAFATVLVVDKAIGPIQALKESARITKGHRWTVLWLLLAMIVLNIVGAIVVFVGLLVSIPVTILALVHAYRTLSGSAAAPAPVAYSSDPAPVGV